jgi:CTP:molybdopterin cytidylyltransferase MocA
MKHCTLVILAGGLGSRFGGNKQISNVGPHGECLMEYSIHDAIEAGFDRVVFILKSDMVETVREGIGRRLEERVRVDYAV